MQIIKICLFVFLPMMYSCKESSKVKSYLFNNEQISNQFITSKIVSYDSFIKVGTDTLFYFKFSSWKGVTDSLNSFIPELSLKGFLSKENSKIYYQPFITAKRSLFFDFEMNKYDTTNIKASFQQKLFLRPYEMIDKNYALATSEKSYNQEINDYIYKFTFVNFGFKYKNDNLNYYVSRKIGVIAITVSMLIEGKECVFMNIGNRNFLEKSIKFCQSVIM